MTAALDHLRILELPGLAGAYCGKLLADLGADVIKIEPPEGDPGRRLAPLAQGTDTSLWFVNFHTNKRSAVVDLDAVAGRRALLSLARSADVVIESFQPGYLDGLGLGYRALRRVNPGLVLTSITPFGQTGQYSRYAGNDLVAAAMSGLLSGQGDPDQPPCAPPLDQGYQLAGVHAAIATLYVLFGRSRALTLALSPRERGAPPTGDHVDISIQEVMGHVGFTIARYDLEAAIPPRPGERGLQPGINVFQAKDGYLHMYSRRWGRLVEWAGIPELEDPQWNDRLYREDHELEANRLVSGFMATLGVAEAMEVGQERGIAVAPLNSPADFVRSPHVRERGFFTEVDDPALGKIPYPGPPYRLSATPWSGRSGAPLLGQHTGEVLGPAAEVLGPAARGEPVEPRAPVRVTRNPGSSFDGLRMSGGAQAKPALPFAGMRVIDFTVAFAGPFAARYLAELGAEVLRVESSKAATNTEDDGGREFRRQFEGGRSAQSMEINRSKRSITLDLHRPEAQGLALRLAEKCDIAINNLRPGTLARWNLGYQHLSRVNPGIIVVDMPGFGTTGPHRNFVSLGATLMAYTGLARLWGHPESPENRRCKLAYPDWVGAGHAVVAILAALHHRSRTGAGQYIEVAQLEATAAMQGVAYLDYLVNGNVWEPAGSRHPTSAPHNVYPCRGEDRWVAIAITSDEEWERLVRALGSPAWAAPDLATAAGRRAREGDIDLHLADWTRQHTPHQAMRLLQRVGVPAGVVQNAEDLYHDPHLRERGYTIPVEQPFIGPVVQSGLTWRFARAPMVRPRGGPRLGEANEYVFCEVLGLSPGKLEALIVDEVVV